MTKWVRSSLTEKEGTMKRLTFVIVAIVGLPLVASLTHAGMSQLEPYYNDQITKKIVNCRRIGLEKNHDNPSMIRLVEMRSAQAEFYRKHREELVQEMVARNIGKEPWKIDHFLVTKFHASP
jgi:hypothetical protein